MRGTLYCEEKTVCVITIHIIHCAKCVIKCAHIVITESIHIEQEVSMCAETSIHLVNNIQFTGADNICTG